MGKSLQETVLRNRHPRRGGARSEGKSCRILGIYAWSGWGSCRGCSFWRGCTFLGSG